MALANGRSVTYDPDSFSSGNGVHMRHISCAMQRASIGVGALAPLGIAVLLLVAAAGTKDFEVPTAQGAGMQTAEVAFSLWNTDEASSSLVVLTDAETATVLSAPPEGVYQRVAVSPDGQSVAVSLADRSSMHESVLLVSADAADQRVLPTSTDAAVLGLAWATSSDTLYVGVSGADGSGGLEAIDTASGQRTSLLRAADYVSDAADRCPGNFQLAPGTVSPEGESLLVQAFLPCAEYEVTEVSVLDLVSGVVRPIGHGASAEQSPDWSPAGDAVVYQADGEVVVDDLAGSISSVAEGELPAWSAAGEISFVTSSGSQPSAHDLAVTEPEAGAAPTPDREVADTAFRIGRSGHADGDIVFLGDRNGAIRLYLQRDGEQPRELAPSIAGNVLDFDTDE